MCVCMTEWGGRERTCFSTYVKLRGQLCEVISLLPNLRGFWGLNLGFQTHSKHLGGTCLVNRSPCLVILLL